jgi:regulator of protease activity HflC (stomatin/prohibitin superfamily)
MATKLEQMQKQRDQLNARIIAERAKHAKKERAEDTRKKILIGAMIAKMVEDGQAIDIHHASDLMGLLDGYLTTKRDRELFGLVIQDKD